MATIVPFRALRPIPESAERVAAVPYDVVTTDEARALAAASPLSFLHVSRAEIDLPPGTNLHADAVYAKAVENFVALKRKAPLVVEGAPSVYVYRLTLGAHVQTGIAACCSLAEYDAGVIKKHERTRRDKEDDRTRHMLELRAQTGPVFLTYRASRPIDGVVQRAAGAMPFVDFTAVDGVRHTIWTVAPKDQRELVEAFAAVPALYIADGHHRAASAARVRQQLRGSSGAAGEWDTFLAVAFPDNQVQVLAYNRVVKDLGSLTPEMFEKAVLERFDVKDGPPTPSRRGEVAMYFRGRWRTLTPKATPGADAIKTLDVSVLQDQLQQPILGIADITTDKRIDFVGGARGTKALETLVDSGQAVVAFSLYPVSVSDLIAVSDAGAIMPPKSTWFEPKLRDGLLIHLI